MTLNTEASAAGSSSKAPADPLVLKWERRKKPSTAYAPSLRSGCTMALWAARNMGVLFGGVTDEDTSEETLESVFHNDLYGYQVAGNGRWTSLLLKRPKKKGGQQKKKVVRTQRRGPESDEDDEEAFGDSEGSEDEGEVDDKKLGKFAKSMKKLDLDDPPQDEVDPDDPMLTVPLPRYNAMLAVLRNTLYMYVHLLHLLRSPPSSYLHTADSPVTEASSRRARASIR